MMDTSFIRVSATASTTNYKWIENTLEEINKSIEEGLPYRSFYCYSSLPMPKSPAPFMYGDLWLVAYDKRDFSLSLEAMRSMLSALFTTHSDIDPYMFRYYLDSERRIYAQIPAAMFGGETGIPLLPMCHSSMLGELLDLCSTPPAQIAIESHFGHFNSGNELSKYFLRSVYNNFAPFMFLPPDIQAGSHYTVEVDFESFMYELPVGLWHGVRSRRKFDCQTLQPHLSSLYELFDSAVFSLYNRYKPYSLEASLKLCQFFRMFIEYPEKMTEEHKTLLWNLLALLGPKGTKIAMELGEKIPDFDTSTIPSHLFAARIQGTLVTCADIANAHGCDGCCDVYTPYDLDAREQAGKAIMENFQERKEGLFYLMGGKDDDSTEEIRVCTPIFTIGRMCDADGVGWKRAVNVIDPAGKCHSLAIPNSVCMKAHSDILFQMLGESGLELSPHPKASALLKRYFKEAIYGPNMESTQNLGWHGDCYVLPDTIIGHYEKKPVYFGSTGAFQTSGTLADWITSIGNYCRGNSLPMLLVQFALSAPLLKFCGVKGGGLHLYGVSTSGKTTLANLMGSVCGGGDKGYVTQWNITSNAMESIAAQHNDGTLILDEIGEASPETVFKSIYMLTNGQGKERLRTDATPKKAHQWLLNYLSTGEKPTAEKIEENRRLQAMTGQEVRAINLPVAGLTNTNVFTELHGFTEPGELSDHLNEASKSVYGTLLRAFLKVLCGANPDELHKNSDSMQKEAKQFVTRTCPPECNPQIRRVAKKFALMAAAGIFACRYGLLPWTEQEATEVAEKWFNIWLENRGTTGNLEVEKAIQAIQNYWARYRESRFHNLDKFSDPAGFSRDLAGYCWKVDDEMVFFLKAEIFSDLTKSVNRAEIIDAMQEKGMLLLTKTGTRMETKSVGGQNVRGFGFRPEAWLGKAEEEKRGISTLVTEEYGQKDDEF